MILFTNWLVMNFNVLLIDYKFITNWLLTDYLLNSNWLLPKWILISYKLLTDVIKFNFLLNACNILLIDWQPIN